MRTKIAPRPLFVTRSVIAASLAAAWPTFNPPGRADVISDWNSTAIRVIQAVNQSTNPNPLPASRSLAMMHVAQFDAVNTVVGCYEPYAAHFSAHGASPEAAAAQAAYCVLTNLYTSQLPALDAALAASLAAVPDGTARTDGLALGNAVASTILALRANDGATAVVPYTPGSGPGVWVPTPPAFAPAFFPQWRYVTPWTMAAPEQFRPGPPPNLDSATYTADFIEMTAIGATNSADIALFHIEFPPYTLGSAARVAVSARPLRLVDNARLFALLYMSVADALISVWDAKFTYNFWRPVTAIPAADTDGNPATDPGPTWTPLRATPPHPEYPAAHTIVSAAGAVVLTSVFGDELPFIIESPTLPGKPRTFARFSDFPIESSNARVWAGFHWRNSTVVAGQMGQQIGQQHCRRGFDHDPGRDVLRIGQPLAFQLLARDPALPAGPAIRLRLIELLADAIGTFGMAGGQAMDLEAEGRQLDVAQVEALHARKTGALIRASVLMGAACRPTLERRLHEALVDFATPIGLAFQIQDDLLDVIGDAATLGKATGADRERRKPTHPAVIGVAASQERVRRLHAQALEALLPFGSRAEPLQALTDWLLSRRY